MESDRLADYLLSRVFLTVASTTVLLTFAFVGLAVLWEGRVVSGVTTRTPFYVLVFSIAFILSLLKLDSRDRDGTQILIATTGIGTATSILIGLATEGIAYTLTEPGVVFQEGLVVVFLSAAIICTGLGIWGVRHWREFVGHHSLPSATGNGRPEMERLK